MNSREIQENEQAYFNIENVDIDNVIETLSGHMRNKLYFNPDSFRTFKELTISDNYSTKNLRETVFISCTIKDADFSEAGFAGSIFKGVTFLEGDYSNTNFRSADFRDTTFRNCTLKTTSFDKSVFWNTCFKKCVLTDVSMCDCKFIDCSFVECTWTVRVENTLFKNSIIKNTTFMNMNFEFAIFENVHLEGVKLPFPTIPYIYGGLIYLSKTQDNVKITSQKNKLGISKDEYLSYLPYLESYYIYTQNYFPLSNILISKEQYQKALACILKGMEVSVLIRRFRMLPNYCRLLAYIPDADTHVRQQFYMNILEYIYNANLKEFEKDNLSIYLPQISSMLLNDTIHNSITVFFETNIEGDDSNRISLLYKIIDDLFSGICKYSIQLRHNSPINALIQFFTDTSNVPLIISIIETVIIGIQTCAIVYDAKNSTKKDGINKKMMQELELLKSKQDQAQGIITENNIIFKNCSITFNGDIHIYK